MDIYEALYTTRMMRRLRPDPIPLETQARILDAAVRDPNGGNTQRWHFVAVDDRKLIREFAKLFRQALGIVWLTISKKFPCSSCSPSTISAAPTSTRRSGVCCSPPA